MSSKNASKTVLGLKVTGHDTGACLMSGGNVVAISEERLNRVKHSRNMFPHLSIPYCLDALGVKPEDIDLIVMDEIDNDDSPKIRAILERENTTAFPNAEIKVINHHLAHAASAFYCSPFEEAAIMVVDGTGSRIKTHHGIKWETDTTYIGKGNEMYQIRKTVHQRVGRTFADTGGIGLLYTLITRKFLEFGRYNEGKTMGLASYGDAENIFKDFPRDLWMKEMNGHFVCNPNIIPQRGVFSVSRFLKYPRKTVAQMKPDILVFIRRVLLHLTALTEGKRYRPVFTPLHIPIPPRKKDAPLPSGPYNDLAAVVQALIEDVFLGISRGLSGIASKKNLCIAGGCGLNGISNDAIIHDKHFSEIFIQPAASDTGIPLGCALWGMHAHFGEKRQYIMKDAYLGRNYSERDVQEALEKAEGISFRKSSGVAKDTAGLLKDSKIIAWFQGRSEYGPRALGSRSILCNPERPDMKDILNERVKHRESWRPFAASVLKERVNDYFDFEYHESPFMLMVPEIKKEKKEKIPSLIHVDGTCRIQTVTKKENGLYYDLIKEFSKETGIPLVLNTSFNLAGEPIVESPEDALRCFLSTEIDYLILGDYIVEKK